jgi:hypothetical protein
MFLPIDSQRPFSATPTSSPLVFILDDVPTLIKKAIEKLLTHNMESESIVGIVEVFRKERATGLLKLVEDLETVPAEVLPMWIEAVGECT